LAESEVWRWLTPLIWLVIGAGVAFVIGLLVIARRASIQREYQKRIKEDEDRTPKQGA